MVQLLVNALALGAAYALVALGFVLVLNAIGAVNFAHGELVMAGGLLAAIAAAAAPVPVPGVLLLPLVVAVMAVLGVAIGAIGYLPLRRRPPAAVFISTIAIGGMVQNTALLAAGPEPRTAPPLLPAAAVELGGMPVSVQSLAIIAVAALLIGGQYSLFHYTRLGRRLRAAAEDPDMARACGIPVTIMVLITFSAGAALAGAAGLLLANRFFVSPGDGAVYILKAYIAITLGGWGSIPGAVAGAFIIAGFETVVSLWISTPLALGLLYLAVLAILIVRPSGLFGEAAGRRL